MGDKGNWYTLGRDIQKILTDQEQIMAKIDDVNAKIAELKDLINTDETAEAEVLAARNARIAELEAQIAEGATGAQLDAINAELDTLKASITPPIV